jgi:hypothetical protein
MSEVKCVELADIDQALSCDEQDNMGGVVPSLIFGYVDDVGAFPDKPAVAESAIPSLEVAGAWKGDVVMKTGCKAYKFEFTDDTAEFTIKQQGEDGGKSFVYELAFISAKIRKKILGFANAVKNRKMFFIVQDNNLQWYLMGDAGHGAKRVDDDGSTTGANYTGRNQNSFKFQYSCPRALIYEGDTTNLLTAKTATP